MNSEKNNITGLLPERFDEVADVTEKVFHDPFMRNGTSKEIVFNYKNTRVLLVDDKIASAVTITPRQMFIDDVIFDADGIGGVSTLPEHRKKGFAGILMKDSIKRMKEIGADISYLYPFSAAYYAKFGYRSVDFKTIVLPKNNIPSEINYNYKIREFKENDLQDILEIYKKFNDKRTGTILRDSHYLQLKIKQFGPLNEKIYIAENTKSETVAYAIASDMKGDWGEEEFQHKIVEIGALPEHINAIEELVYFISKERLTDKFDRIYLDDIDGIKIKGAHSLTEEDKKSYNNLKDVKMFKIINFESFMNKMTKIFNRRLKKNNILIKSYLEVINFEFLNSDEEGINHTILIKFKKEEINIDEGTFLNWIFGNYSNDINLSEEAKKILKILFPSIRSVYWDQDYL